MNRRNFLKWIGGAGVSLSFMPALGWGKETSADVPLMDKKQRTTLSKNFSAGRFTFENFVEGDANRFAKAAALAVAERPGLVYNSLVIYGDIGLGKTHLLRAIENRLRVSHKSLNVLCMTTEKFVNDFVDSMMTNNITGFRKKYREVDALLIDDIEYLSHTERSQEELFYILEHLLDSGKQVVMTANRIPELIQGLDKRLKSRLSAALLVDIQPSEYGLRFAVVKEKARQDAIYLPDDVAFLIAGRTSSIREAEAELAKGVFAYYCFVGREISKPLALDVLKYKD